MRLELKKQKKKAALLKAAYTLFLKNGVNATSVGDITAEAGVAKGTFYLYFREKQDIVTEVADHVARQILEEAYVRILDKKTGRFSEDLALIADAILDILSSNRPLLSFLGRDFKFPTFREKLNQSHNAVWRALKNDMKSYAAATHQDEKALVREIYCLLSMCGSVACSSVLEGVPEDMSAMRPSILSIIRKSFPSE